MNKLFIVAVVLSLSSGVYAGPALEQAGANEQNCSWLKEIQIPIPAKVEFSSVKFGNCGGQLAVLHPDWGSSSIAKACESSDAGCVLSLARLHPEWGSDSLGNACKEDVRSR